MDGWSEETYHIWNSFFQFDQLLSNTFEGRAKSARYVKDVAFGCLLFLSTNSIGFRYGFPSNERGSSGTDQVISRRNSEQRVNCILFGFSLPCLHICYRCEKLEFISNHGPKYWEVSFYTDLYMCIWGNLISLLLFFLNCLAFTFLFRCD